MPYLSGTSTTAPPSSNKQAIVPEAVKWGQSEIKLKISALIRYAVGSAIVIIS